jgi:pyruvate formate-lyase activating enzyme-like uncharacterized protein
VNGTVIGALATGVLLFISSLLVPVVSKKLNKATDAADSASKISAAAAGSADMALKIAQQFEKQLGETRKQCTDCAKKLAALEKKLQEERQQDRLERDTMYAAMSAAVTLLASDAADQTAALRAAMELALRVRDD